MCYLYYFPILRVDDYVFLIWSSTILTPIFHLYVTVPLELKQFGGDFNLVSVTAGVVSHMGSIKLLVHALRKNKKRIQVEFNVSYWD